jgi:hypothetical protein
MNQDSSKCLSALLRNCDFETANGGFCRNPDTMWRRRAEWTIPGRAG